MSQLQSLKNSTISPESTISHGIAPYLLASAFLQKKRDNLTMRLKERQMSNIIQSFDRKPKEEPILTHQVRCAVTPEDFTKAKALKLSWNQLLNMGINSANVLGDLKTKDVEIYDLKKRIEKLAARLQFYINKKNALLQENCKLKGVILDDDVYYAKENEEFYTFLFDYQAKYQQLCREVEASERDELSKLGI